MAEDMIIDSLNRKMLATHNNNIALLSAKFLKETSEMDISESFAAQGLASSQTPNNVAGLNTAAGVPVSIVRPA